MKEEYQSISEMFNDDNYGYKGAVVPKTCNELTSKIDSKPYELAAQENKKIRILMISQKQRGNPLFFIFRLPEII